jgi:uncharacterized membrane protein YfcA
MVTPATPGVTNAPPRRATRRRRSFARRGISTQSGDVVGAFCPPSQMASFQRAAYAGEPGDKTNPLSAPFILANSAVGLVGAMYAGQMASSETLLYAVAALAGAMIGTVVGLRWLSQTVTRYILAVILGAAGLQLLLF